MMYHLFSGFTILLGSPMIDINILRENPKIVEDDIHRRQRVDMIPKVKELISKDTERRKLIGEADKLRAERNKITDEIAKIKKTVDAIEGQIAGFGENVIIVTPKFAEIHKAPAVAKASKPDFVGDSYGSSD